MTYSNYDKVFKQLSVKPAKLGKYIKHNAPKKRNSGKNRKRCRRCGRPGAHIGKYELDLCRHCFRDVSTKIGFKKYS